MNDAKEQVLMDETTITEITIWPDGRVFVFGTSRLTLDLLEQLNPHAHIARSVLQTLRKQETAGKTA